MSDVMLGATLPQFTDDVDRLVNGARRAEELGLDSIWVFDHLWPLTGGKERPIFECWTALAWLAAATERIRLGTLVTRSSLRHPALLAKMIATVGSIAPGRLTVAIGSGDEASRGENESYGIDYLAGADRVRQLTSTIRIVRDYLHEDAVTFENDLYSIRDLPTSPRPPDVPRLWVGGRSDDVLEVAGLVADGWNGWGGTPERFEQDAASVIDFAGERDVELTWGGLVTLDATDAAAEEKFGTRSRKDWTIGGPETVAARFNEFVAAGARHVIATFPDAGGDGVYELLATEVKTRLG